MIQERIDWTSLGRELGRRPRRCSAKWDRIQRAKASTESVVNLKRTEPTSSDYAKTAYSPTSSTSSSSSDDESNSDSSSGTESDSDSSSCSSSQSSTLSQGRSVPTSGGAEVGTENSSAVSHSRWSKEEVWLVGFCV